jgi:hypothetical protein
MEGFVPSQVNEIFGNELRLNATLIATLGYRHEEDATQYYKKLENQTKNYLLHL